MESIRRAGRRFFQAVALIIILGAAGFLAWFVWQAKHHTEKSLNDTSQAQGTTVKNTEKTAPAAAPADATTDWTSYTSEDGKFSLRYPKTWVQPLNRDLCSPDLFKRAVYLGPEANSVLKCGSEYFGQMSVLSVDGDKRSDYNLGAGYKQMTTKDVTINGVTGQRISGLAAASSPDTGYAPVENTIEVRYVFYAPNGTTYVARYTQAPKGHSPSTDVLADFDLMVTKTLKFGT